MIDMVNFFKSVQLPGGAGAKTNINLGTMTNIRIERVEIGLELHFGRLDGPDKAWKATGQVITVTWQNIADFSEKRSVNPQPAVKK